MKAASLLVMILVVLFSFNAQAGYSSGYRMGQLTKLSIKGLMFKTVEGQLLMGREGTPLVKIIGKGDDARKVTVNPWYFSNPKSDYARINQFAGAYVAIKYEQVRINNPKYSTDYRILKVFPVTRKLPIKRSYEIEKPSGTNSDGFRVGRIVKVSQKGHLIKTNEVVLQVGNSGNQFKRMSVNHDGLYAYAIKVLRSGKKAKIYYKENAFYQVTLNDTKYKIWKIEVIKDL